MVCVQVAEFKHASETRYVLVTVYRFAQTWLEIASLTKVVTVFPAQLSVPVIKLGSEGGTREAHCTVIGAGHENTGGTSSTILNICIHVSRLLPSEKMYRRVMVMVSDPQPEPSESS